MNSFHLLKAAERLPLRMRRDAFFNFFWVSFICRALVFHCINAVDVARICIRLHALAKSRFVAFSLFATSRQKLQAAVIFCDVILATARRIARLCSLKSDVKLFHLIHAAFKVDCRSFRILCCIVLFSVEPVCRCFCHLFHIFTTFWVLILWLA